MNRARVREFDVFLSYSHDDAEWVHGLAVRLQDEHGLRVWLDRWRLVPGESWQQEMARGLDLAHACVVCVGPTTPDGWCQQEIERALDIQSRDQDFRVIPLLLPGASTDAVPPFLGLRTWVDFRHGVDEEYQLHRLKCGIKGEAPGPWPGHSSAAATNSATDLAERKLRDLQRLEKYVPREVVIETQKKILNRWLKT